MKKNPKTKNENSEIDSLLSRPKIEYLDTEVKPFVVQVPLWEYFERVKRHRADRWQVHLCEELQGAVERRHLGRYWGIIHAEGQLGKTSIISQCFPAWLFGHDPLFRFALAMYNVTRSQMHSGVVIQIMQSKVHKDIFPNREGWIQECGVRNAEGGMEEDSGKVQKSDWEGGCEQARSNVEGYAIADARASATGDRVSARSAHAAKAELTSPKRQRVPAGMPAVQSSKRAVAKAGWLTCARRELNDGQLSFNPVGLISGLTGSGFDWLGIDDPYKEAKEAFSEQMRQNMANFWEYTVMSRVGLHSSVTGMFHRYAPDDFAGYLLDTGNFKYLRYATECDGDYIHETTGARFPDPLDRELGELISPERRPASYYLKQRRTKRVWNSMCQGRPSSEEGEFFNVGRVGIVSSDEGALRREECAVVVRAWDLAATAEGGDYSVGVLLGMSADRRVTIFDMVREQVDAAGRDELQKRTAMRDGPNVVVSVPEDPGAAGKTTALHIQQLLKRYEVVVRSTTGSKQDRARNLASAMNSGDVEFVSDELLGDERRWNQIAKREFRNFPLSENDDIVDAGADAYNEAFERVSKGLVVSGFRPQRNLRTVEWFECGVRNAERGIKKMRRLESRQDAEEDAAPAALRTRVSSLRIPSSFTVYAGVKITAEATLANSGVIVARGSENSGMGETLFVVAEYKAWTADFYELFDWLEDSLRALYDGKLATIWLHPLSESYAATIRQKLNIPVRVFDGDILDGVTEMNWYMRALDGSKNEARLYGIVESGQLSSAADSRGLYYLRQEAHTWAFNAKGQPNQVGGVLDCLRMIARLFRTFATPRTRGESVEAAMPEELKFANLLRKSPLPRGLTDAQQIRRVLAEEEVREGMLRDSSRSVMDEESGEFDGY